MAKGKKPKFQVNQIVMLRGRGSRRDFGRRIFGAVFDGREWRYRISMASADGGFRESELRPLTSREIGPTRKLKGER